ncbi:MAG: class I poly(R)-hydroxyalkanoic acid synthase [Roseovarius sp.]|nr:class I poly(R)-hydroxyalkanoic acid synthase [Roseovarius sp.]
MTEEELDDGNFDRLTSNIQRMEQISKRLVDVLLNRRPLRAELNSPAQEIFAKAFTSHLHTMIEDPGKIYERQLDYWAAMAHNFMHAQQDMLQGSFAAADDGEDDPLDDDRRFSNPLWKTSPYFRLIKLQYALNKKYIEQIVSEADNIDEKDRRRLGYFAEQIINMMSPTNFLGTNPDALEKAVATEGESLVHGLENLVEDLEANNGELVVRLADEDAFEVGLNIATTPGEVIYRNHMMEIIQYSPGTDAVREVPVVLFPPWINKYYILDLKEQNSLVKWIVDKGYTLFVVSWVNPDSSYSDIGMEDYIEDGFLTAIKVAKSITGQDKVNSVGYCIAGTTLHLVLSLLAKRGDDSVQSATFFTALTDFSDQGEFTPFLQDDFIDGIEAEVAEEGILRSFIMSRTMSFLRSNDLVYTPAIRSYMMGETPPAFDLLYWNGDGSNLPGKMTMKYLRELCQGNRYVKDGIELCGERLHISDVKIPIMAIACETDHIAAWKNCYQGLVQTFSSNRTFILSGSGHIAGIVNPPAKRKYGYYTNSKIESTPEAWRNNAVRQEGSWWPRWESWLKERSGDLIPARKPGNLSHPSLCKAPGSYVLVKSVI